MKAFILVIFALGFIAAPLCAEPLGSAFTYQGKLSKSGAPVSGAQDFKFELYGSLSGSNQIGPTITLNDVQVIDGLFQVNLDFGAQAFGTQQRFLQIGVAAVGAGTYTELSPRAAVMPAPVALSVAADGVTSASIADGSVSREKLAPYMAPRFLSSVPFTTPISTSSQFPFLNVDANSEDLELKGNHLLIKTAGTYIVNTRLKFSRFMSTELGVGVELTLNGEVIKRLASELNSLSSETFHIVSGSEIIQAQAGDELSLQIYASGAGLMLEGNSLRTSSFDVVRID